MLVKYIWNISTLVRSNGVKIKVKKGKNFEVNEKEYQNLKWNYKNLFEFEDLSDEKINNDKVIDEVKKETVSEVIEEPTVLIEEEVEVIEEVIEEKKEIDNPFND